jgi:hypothetical protein
MAAAAAAAGAAAAAANALGAVGQHPPLQTHVLFPSLYLHSHTADVTWKLPAAPSGHAKHHGPIARGPSLGH